MTLVHVGCIHCNDFPSYICDQCSSLICKYCQNDHKCVDEFHKGGLIKCYSANEQGGIGK